MSHRRGQSGVALTALGWTWLGAAAGVVAALTRIGLRQRRLTVPFR